jgi:glycosyltransferase involved in cell wall biosynthesis
MTQELDFVGGMAIPPDVAAHHDRGTIGPCRVLEVVITPYPEVRGGVDTMVGLLVQELRALGCHVTIFVPGAWEAGRLSERVVDGISVNTLRLRTPNAPRRKLRHFAAWCLEMPLTLWRLHRLCRRQGIEVIHIHTATNYLFYFRLLRMIGGPPYVVTLHRGEVVDFRNRSTIDRWLIRFGLRGAAATTAVADWLRDLARSTFGQLPRITTVHNGFRCRLPDAGAMVERWSALAGGQPFFLMVAFLDPQKGHDVAIQAWAKLRRDASAAQLFIVGDGDLREECRRLIAETGCGDTVHMLGQVPHDAVMALMRQAAGLVFPSRSEGLSYALLEAGLAGLPVICTDIPAFAEVITDGENGLLVPTENPDAVAVAVERILADPAGAAQMGAQLQALVKERFSSRGMAQNYLSLFVDIAADSSSD